MQSPYSSDEDDYIVGNAGKLTWEKIGDHLDRSSASVRSRHYQLRVQGKIDPQFKTPADSNTKTVETEAKEYLVRETVGNHERIDSCSHGIRTVEDLLEACKVDLTLWEVAGKKVKAYQSFFRDSQNPTSDKEKGKGWKRTAQKVQMYSVQVTLKRIPGAAADNNLRKQLLADMIKLSPRVPALVRPPVLGDDRMLYVLSMPDQHWGKLAWGPETGENFDLKISSSRFLRAISHFVARSKYFPIEKVVLVVGNDALNSDGSSGATTAGTRQDSDGRWQKVFLEAKRCYFQAIETIRSIAPVDVIVVQGNHDYTSAFHLGDTIESRFYNTPDVRVDNSPAIRKYIEYGVNLIGLAHGNLPKNEKLAKLMPAEAKAAWARTWNYEFLLGHYHRRGEERFKATESDVQITMRTLSALCGVDAWHKHNGYLSMPASEAILYSKTRGFDSNISYNVIPEPIPHLLVA